MNEGENFMKDIMNQEIPDIELVYTGKELSDEDLKGQIEALKSEVEVLEGRYEEKDKPVIEAKKRKIQDLEEEFRSRQN